VPLQLANILTMSVAPAAEKPPEPLPFSIVDPDVAGA
jgi:hypothetical protein